MRRCAESADEAASGDRAMFAGSNARWHLLAVVLLGIASSASVWGLLEDREYQLLMAEFAARAQERTLAISREVQNDVEILHSASAFFAGSDAVHREDFETFVGALVSRAGSVLAVEWAPRVPLDAREEFERRLARHTGTRAEILESGDRNRLQPAALREFYFPVEFRVESGGVRSDAIGFDHASDSLRWNAMQQALESGSAVATERIKLFEETAADGDRFGVLVVQPVFANDAGREGLTGRREQLRGFILGFYRVPDVVRRALADFTDTGLNCRVVDLTDAARAEHLYVHGIEGADASFEPVQVKAAAARGLVYSTPLHVVPGRQWVVQCWPTEEFIAAHTSLIPVGSLLFGLVATGLLGILVWIVDGRADAVERTVIERTAELRDANRQLEEEVRDRMAAEARFAEHARNLEESNRQLEQVRVELQRQATIDPLTGVLNRLSFAEQFASEWTRTGRLDLPLSCVLLDVDFFKKINDTHGHPVGDAVLRSLAAMLRTHTRSYDSVARFGGEEFCILLPETSESDAIDWADGLRKWIAATPMDVGEDVLHITISLGVATRRGDHRSCEELLNQADEAMLVAKRQGRNRLVAFGDLHRLAAAGHESRRDIFGGACAADIMTPVLVHLTPAHPLHEAARVLLSLRLDSVPVIDDEGRTLGIIGEEDLTAQMLSDKGWQQVVADAMNPTPVTYEYDTPAADICGFLSRVAVRRVIILQDGRPVGLISRSTLIRWLRNALLCDPVASTSEGDADAADVSDRLHSTIDRLTKQIAALQEGVESSQGSVTPMVVSVATRIQELVDDALMLSADKEAEEDGYATMGAVLS